jgi:hypothetical protein
MKADLSKKAFSFWASKTDTKPFSTMTLSELHERITEPCKKEIDHIQAIRDAVEAGDDDAAAELKGELSAVTLSGTFTKRKAEALKQHSGLITADLDDLEPERLEPALDALRGCEHVALCFTSPSGRGVKAAFAVEPVPANAAEHQVAFGAVSNFCRDRLGLQLDQSGKDVSRLCFLSYDPDAVLKNAVPLDVERWRDLTKEELKRERITNLVAANTIKSLADEPPAPPPLITYGEQQPVTLATAGNLVVIEGLQKVGKSAVVSALIGAAFADMDAVEAALEDGEPDPFFGLRVGGDRNGYVLHIDSEQSTHDHFSLIRTACRRAGLSDVPAALVSTSLLNASYADRLAALEVAVEDLCDTEAGLRFAIVDGVADLLESPNDEKTAFALVDRLFALANSKKTVVALVLHTNPGSDIAKSRGHLGSQLWRKCQSAIGIERGEDGISSIHGKFLRSGHWPKSEAAHFAWNDKAGMHVAVDDPTEERRKAKAAGREKSLTELADAILGKADPAVGYGELLQRIEATGVSTSTAKNRIREMKSVGILKQNAGGNYERAR